MADGSKFPSAGNFRVKVDSELMLATSRTGNTLTVTRGVEGTSGATHTNGASVYQILTAAGLLNSPGPMTTTGDMIYLDSSGNATRLPVGTSVQVLGGGTIPAWTAAPTAASFLSVEKWSTD